MELDWDSVLDCLFILAPIQFILVMCLTIFYGLRNRWPIKVNCWFCNENIKIWRRDWNWWLCPSCQQYNGFSKDGDYSYDIPEQYATIGKCTRYCSSSKKNNVANVPKSNLCIDCNKRESLKLLELSKFEPRSENVYNAELKIFMEYLEKKYPLCSSCKSLVRDVLSKQALWLTRYKMLFFRQKPVKTFINTAKKSSITFRFIAMVFTPIVSYNHDVIWLPFGGLFFHLCAWWASSMKKNSDALSTILWCCMIILVLVKNLMTSQNIWFTVELVTQCHMVAVCALLIFLLNIKPSSRHHTSITPVSLKKLKSHIKDAITLQQFPYDNPDRDGHVLSETNSSVESSGGAGGESFTGETKSHLVAPKQKTTSIQSDRCLSPVTVSKTDSPYFHYLDNNVSVLSALSLSEDSSRYSIKTPPIFQRRIYSGSTSDLFRRSGAVSGKRCVLSPPKLRSVTQTSWVAGGYWQEGMMSGTPTLSRSSSQSSGFGSAGSSNFAPSREPSVHEFDRCSVVSDVTQSCYMPRGNVASPTMFCANSAVSRTQSHCSMHDAMATTTTTRLGNCSQSPALRVCSNALIAEGHHTCQEHTAISNGSPADPVPPVCPSHTTLVASPGLLMTLFCASLILNMIVLCAMLLR